MKAKCNECNEVNKLNAKKKRFKINNGIGYISPAINKTIDKHYYRCEHCGHEYIIGYTDEDIRKKRKNVRKLIKMNTNGLLDIKIQATQKEIEHDMNRLRQRIESVH